MVNVEQRQYLQIIYKYDMKCLQFLESIMEKKIKVIICVRRCKRK